VRDFLAELRIEKLAAEPIFTLLIGELAEERVAYSDSFRALCMIRRQRRNGSSFGTFD